ncbi:recombinase family protein [Amycolatopsis sp. FDAARGOS 1241]|uniref:recombinase family protein n=1 Tax=Amycolatopsis sp. FDAARGOS 1241 TaxID=2778070 RepID=UPI001EF1A05F|nr:recombinase family protein [Amycolatopsis sp. FDAARGOS 1241]
MSLDLTGEGLAVERQREDCERIVRSREWSLVETYVDNSISATDKTKVRPSYDRMVADFKAKRFDALVCWDLDRLTRQPRQLEDWIDAAEEQGLRLVTANGEADLSTDGGRMYARIKAAVARAEVERKGARQSRAQQQRAKQGRPPRGVRATGYTLDGEVIAAEAQAVRAVFEAFATGTSLKALAAALSGAERLTREVGDKTHIQVLPASVPVLPTRSGQPWNPSTVTGMLRNPRYAGWSMLAGEIVRDESGRPVQGQWEPIVQDSLWLDVQRRLDDPKRKSNKTGTDRKHLGSGLYLCGICDRPVKAHNVRYRCAGHVMRTRAAVDAFVLEIVRARLARLDLSDLLPTVQEAEIDQLHEQIEQARGRIERARADYRAELIDGPLYKEIKAEAEASIQRLDAERLSLSASPATAAILAAEDPVEAFDNADLATRRAVIDMLAVVRLFPAPRGLKVFNPDTVKIQPRARARGLPATEP